jgi:hypothetical protein
MQAYGLRKVDQRRLCERFKINIILHVLKQCPTFPKEAKFFFVQVLTFICLHNQGATSHSG